MKIEAMAAIVAAAALAGCINVKTESEIKPIHITMDVNLKVDKELDKAFAEDDRAKGRENFRAVKEMTARGAAGMTAKAYLAEREGASDADRLLIAEENARRMKKFSEIAKSNGISMEAVEKRYAERMRGKIPAGTWYETDSGEWLRK